MRKVHIYIQRKHPKLPLGAWITGDCGDISLVEAKASPVDMGSKDYIAMNDMCWSHAEGGDVVCIREATGKRRLISSIMVEPEPEVNPLPDPRTDPNNNPPVPIMDDEDQARNDKLKKNALKAVWVFSTGGKK